MTYNEDKNAEIVMKIIIESGEARKIASDALNSVKNLEFNKARELLEEARKHIFEAHKAQTDTIQSEIAGESKFEPVLLFNHAQDNLMTVMSEIHLIEQLISVFEGFYEKLKK